MKYFYNEYPIREPNTLKLQNDERVLVQTIDGNWYLVKRAGQRSWEAVCVAESGEPNYKSEFTKTISGNSSTIMSLLNDTVGVRGAYRVDTVKMYRIAMISIVSSGQIDSRMEVHKVSLND